MKLEDICSESGLSEKEFLTYITEVTPHSVYVDSRTRKVIPANVVAKTEFMKLMQEFGGEGK